MCDEISNGIYEKHFTRHGFVVWSTQKDQRKVLNSSRIGGTFNPYSQSSLVYRVFLPLKKKPT